MYRLLTFLAFVIATAMAVDLLPCPDCQAMVSPRALMCPKCGCKGDVIADEARILAAKARPVEPDRLVRADLGRVQYDALPVRMDDGLYIVMPLEQVLDVQTLEFYFASTNLMIGYSMPEVALNQPLVRFPIMETNLLFAAASTNIYSHLAETRPTPLSSAIGWQAVQPKAFKNHGKILLQIKAGANVKLPSQAHPYYKLLADRWSQKGE